MKAVAGQSNIKITVHAEAKNSATIPNTGCKITYSGGSMSVSSNGNGDFEANITAISSSEITVTVTDSRGNSSSQKITIDMIPYFEPLFRIEASRPYTTSSEILLSIVGSWFIGNFGVVTNSLTLKYQYCLASDSNWSSLTDIMPNQQTSIGQDFDYELEYKFRIYATDSIGSRMFSGSLSKGVPIVDIGENDVVINGALAIGANYDPAVSSRLQIDGRGFTDLIYPVGSIYLSAVSTNPSTYLGGTWIAWGKGRVPVGVDEDQTEFEMAEKTGGEKTHTLTTGEMPTHVHTPTIDGRAIGVNDGSLASWHAQAASNWSTSGILTSTTSAGSGQAHNNLQPYITCYMWKRTA